MDDNNSGDPNNSKMKKTSHGITAMPLWTPCSLVRRGSLLGLRISIAGATGLSNACGGNC